MITFPGYLRLEPPRILTVSQVGQLFWCPLVVSILGLIHHHPILCCSFTFGPTFDSSWPILNAFPCSAIGYHSLIIYSTFVFVFQWHVLYLCIPIMIRFSATCDTLSCGHFDAVTDLAFLFMFALDSHHLPDPRAFSHSPTSIITDYFCLVHRY
ncbi:hypothetical protein C8J56DRAFT_286817 [Mycena floridula]|nr:hypothetical protein C8J56DRAFT_286817 [Mycena floridula]